MDKGYSTGETAEELGVTRDSLISAIRAGAPDASLRVGGRRLFSDEDIENLKDWFISRGRDLETKEGGDEQ